MKGTEPNQPAYVAIKSLMHRFSEKSQSLIHHLFPHYRKLLCTGRTSFRPAKIEGRKTSTKKDDTRLHVDAFPSTPVRGERILRVFCNINSQQDPRCWNLGEPFDRVAERFATQIDRPFPGKHCLLNFLGMTKSKRSLYDHYMLNMHDTMKSNDDYQAQAIEEKFSFPADSTWIVFTDLVSHAATSGQHLLEQTFYLPVEGQWKPELAPLKKLEKILKCRLVS